VDDFESLSEKLARATSECDRLREENSRLRQLLNRERLNQAAHRSEESLIADPKDGPETRQDSALAAPEPVNTSTPAKTANVELPVAEKIALFRSLFRGRDDVYAVRWEAANGKSGYSPASIKDWDALRLVPKSEWKKRDKETRQLLPLTGEALHDHLSGKITIGVYPLLPDETCWFLAVDFDRETWRQDAGAFILSNRAGTGRFRQRSSGRVPVTARTSGSSSRLRSPPRSQES
jgi:hypothetical protein